MNGNGMGERWGTIFYLFLSNSDLKQLRGGREAHKKGHLCRLVSDRRPTFLCRQSIKSNPFRCLYFYLFTLFYIKIFKLLQLTTSKHLQLCDPNYSNFCTIKSCSFAGH